MIAVAVAVSVLVLLIGFLQALTPYLMPPTECFAVTVPPSAKQDPRIKGIYTRYVAVVAIASIACSIAIPLAVRSRELLDKAIIIGPLCMIAVSLAAMLIARSRVREIKAREGWTATREHAAAFIADDTVPKPISLAWNLLYLVPVAASAAFALANYDSFPARIPMQVSLDGTVTRYADKSLATVLFPAAATAFLGLVLSVAQWMIARSKRPVDPAAPASSAYAYGRFVRAHSIVLLLGGLGICTAIAILFNLTALSLLSLPAAAVIMLVPCMAFLVAEIWLAVAYGQSGARLAQELRSNDSIAQDDDKHWILGGIYCNAQDPSFVVPKRFGVGWTVNVASKRVWIAIGLLVLVTVAFVLAFGM